MKNNLSKLSISRPGTALKLIVMLLILLCLFLPACNESPQETFHHLDQRGDKYFSAHNYQKAIEIWTESLAIKPEAPAVYQKIGDCYHKMAEYDQALLTYNKKLQLQPEDWQTRFKVAKIQLALMNLTAAEKNWNDIKTRINNSDSLIFHGDLLSLQNRYSEAEHEYRLALGKKPQNQTAMIRLANCLAGGKTT
jgi:tetratricopeptide (TPR) repeat protein